MSAIEAAVEAVQSLADEAMVDWLLAIERAAMGWSLEAEMATAADPLLTDWIKRILMAAKDLAYSF